MEQVVDEAPPLLPMLQTVSGSSSQTQITPTSIACDQAQVRLEARTTDGGFTVPAEVLTELPAGSSPGALGLASGRAREIRIPNTDLNSISHSDSTTKSVRVVQP